MGPQSLKILLWAALAASFLVTGLWGAPLGLGIPFGTYMPIYLAGIAASVIAMQCDRIEQGSWLAQAHYETARFALAWLGLLVLGSLAWPALLILAALQLRWNNALFLIAIGAVPGVVVAGITLALLRDIPRTIILHRICSAIAFGAAIYLWAQALAGGWR